MSETLSTELLYFAVVILTIAVLILSVLALRLRSRVGHPLPFQPDDASVPPERASRASRGEEKARSTFPTTERGLSFNEQDFLLLKDRLNYRLRYESLGKLAREERINAAHDRQNIRAALSSLGPKGVYVFEDLVTEAGAIDFLCLSTWRAMMILARTEEGYIWRDTMSDLIVHADDPPELDPETGEEIRWGSYLPENLDLVLQDLNTAYHREVGITRQELAWTVICFTRAKIQRESSTRANPWGLCPLMDLASWLDPVGEQGTTFTEARLLEVVAATEKVYSREPFVRPTEVESDR